MKFSKKLILPCFAVVLALALCVTDVMAQPGGGRGGRQRGQQGGGPGGGGRAGGGGPGGSVQFLLRREDVQKDLELSDDQLESIEKMNDRERGGDRGGDRDAIRAELEGLSDEERAEKFREMREERTAAIQKQLDDLLLPHQVERLAQIAAQFSAQGGARSLTNGSLAEKLDITDEQKERLIQKAEELQKELSEKVAKLRAQMQEELLAELTSDQRAQYKEMMGDAFTFEQQQRGPGGRGGDAGGGRGGDRGGAGGDRGGRGGDRGGAGGDRGGRGGDRGGAGGDRGDRGGDRGDRGGRGGGQNDNGDA